MFGKIIELFQSVLTYYLGLFPPILALVALSLTMFVLFLPLYKISDGLVERDKKRRFPMQDDLEKIKRVSNSVERYHYTKVLYRLHNYHPIQSMVGIVGLALQAPLFLLAYFGLHSYEGFEGMSTWVFKNLGEADGLFNLVPEILSINILPIVMTALSILSGWIYGLGDKKRDWLRILFFPLVFLVLLYKEPTALVIYWTMNNVLSCAKNVVLAYKKGITFKDIVPSKEEIIKLLNSDLMYKFITVLFFVGLASFTMFAIMKGKIAANGILLSKISIFILLVVYLYFAVKSVLLFLYSFKLKNQNKAKIIDKRNTQINMQMFLHLCMSSFILVFSIIFLSIDSIVFDNVYKKLVFISFLLLLILISLLSTSDKKRYIEIVFNFIRFLTKCETFMPKRQCIWLNMRLVFLQTIMLGVVSPLLVFSSDPKFFLQKMEISKYVLIVLGILFVLELLVLLFSLTKLRTYIAAFLTILFIYFFFNIFLFPGSFGQMDFVKFQNNLTLPPLSKFYAMSIFVLITIFVMCCMSFKKYKLYNLVVIAISLVLGIVLVDKLYIIGVKMNNVVRSTLSSVNNESKMDNNEVIEFSTNKKNILIIMLDRFIGSYVPYILDADKDLKDKLDGFVYYPNSISQSAYTIGGFPPILGGYEYSLGTIKKEISEGVKKNLDSRFIEAFTLIPYALKDNYDSMYVDVDASLTNVGLGILEQKKKELGIHSKITYAEQSHFFREKSKEFFKLRNDDNKSIQESKLQWEKLLLAMSLFRASGNLFRQIIYGEGSWMGIFGTDTSYVSAYQQYLSLLSLKNMSYSTQTQNNKYIVVHNLLTHHITEDEFTLNYFAPNVPGNVKSIFLDVENKEKGLESYSHFVFDMLALRILADYIAWMKSHEVYDNTKIYIVSDHGRGILNPLLRGKNVGELDKMWFSSLLISKDYYSRGELRINSRFTTNADVAYEILLGEEITNNPYTGKKIERNIPNPLPLYYTEWVAEKSKELVNNDYDIFVHREYELYNQDIYNDDNWALKE